MAGFGIRLHIKTAPEHKKQGLRYKKNLQKFQHPNNIQNISVHVDLEAGVYKFLETMPSFSFPGHDR